MTLALNQFCKWQHFFKNWACMCQQPLPLTWKRLIMLSCLNSLDFAGALLQEPCQPIQHILQWHKSKHAQCTAKNNLSSVSIPSCLISKICLIFCSWITAMEPDKLEHFMKLEEHCKEQYKDLQACLNHAESRGSASQIVILSKWAPQQFSDLVISRIRECQPDRAGPGQAQRRSYAAQATHLYYP